MPTPQERFWAKVTKTETCWLWTGATHVSGYGIVRVGDKTQRAHRVSYLWEHGAIPDRMDLDHLCRVRHCVRPSHLEPVTRGTNVLRGEGVSAQAARATVCPKGHPYDAENTRHDVRGDRFCRRCKLDYQREWERRKRRKVSAPDAPPEPSR